MEAISFRNYILCEANGTKRNTKQNKNENEM